MRIAKIKQLGGRKKKKLLGFKKLAEGARPNVASARFDATARKKQSHHQLWIPKTVGSSSRLRDSHSEVVSQLTPNSAKSKNEIPSTPLSRELHQHLAPFMSTIAHLTHRVYGMPRWPLTSYRCYNNILTTTYKGFTWCTVTRATAREEEARGGLSRVRRRKQVRKERAASQQQQAQYHQCQHEREGI